MNNVTEQSEKEVWIPIKGYEGLYEISTKSRFRSLDRVIQGNGGTDYNILGRMLNPFKDNKGYLNVKLSKNGKSSTHRSHRLIAAHFIPNPEDKSQVNHINGIKSDNRIENLEWVTPKENIQHACDNNLMKAAYKPVRQLTLNGEVVKDWSSLTEAAKVGGFNRGAISGCIIGAQQTHRGFKWILI